jgi:hypothetical protein
MTTCIPMFIGTLRVAVADDPALVVRKSITAPQIEFRHTIRAFQGQQGGRIKIKIPVDFIWSNDIFWLWI